MVARLRGLLKYPASRPTELVSVSFGLPHSIGCVRIRKCEGPKPTGASPVRDTSTVPVIARLGAGGEGATAPRRDDHFIPVTIHVTRSLRVYTSRGRK